MRKTQEYLPLIKDGEFVSPNRRTYYQLLANGLKTERVGAPPAKRDEPKVMNGRTKKERKAIAKEFGSTGTNIKKKHYNRQRIKDENKDFIDIEQQKYEYFHGENNE